MGIFFVDTSLIARRTLTVIFIHGNPQKQPVEGWKVESSKIENGKRFVTASLELNDGDDLSSYLALNGKFLGKTGGNSRSGRRRSEFNKELAEANYYNQRLRDTSLDVTKLGGSLPNNPKIVK
jgi:hypothetical protein